MSTNIFSQTIGSVLQAVKPVMSMIDDPSYRKRLDDPLACDFLLGNPQEMPLPGFVEALQQQIAPRDKNWFAYKDNEPKSRQVVAEDLSAWRKVNFDPQDIFLTNGAFGGLAVCLRLAIDPGDEVIFISPPWFFYEALILANGGVPVRVSIEPQTFDLDLGAIEAAITPRTRAIIINTPNNPTGKIYPEDTLKGLGEILTAANQHNHRPILLLSDESYSRIVYDGRTFHSPTSFYPYSFLIYTFGKTLLTPGQRMGYIALAPNNPEREALRPAVVGAQFLTGYAFPNALLQHALPDLTKLSIDVAHLQQKRDRLVRELQSMGYSVHSPEGTFYLLPKSPWQDDLSFIQLLSQYHIYCLPGLAAEMPAYFRISLTASDAMIERALPGFAAAFEKAQVKAAAD
jgi:aspartate aminotransferase